MLRAHMTFAWFVVAANAIVGTWALVAHWLARLVVPALWWCVGVAYGSAVLQALMGVYLITVGGFTVAGSAAGSGGVAGFHVFYGTVVVIAIAIGFIYAKANEWVQEHRPLFFGLLSLFVMGLSIRAMITVNAV